MQPVYIFNGFGRPIKVTRTSILSTLRARIFSNFRPYNTSSKQSHRNLVPVLIRDGLPQLSLSIQATLLCSIPFPYLPYEFRWLETKSKPLEISWEQLKEREDLMEEQRRLTKHRQETEAREGVIEKRLAYLEATAEDHYLLENDNGLTLDGLAKLRRLYPDLPIVQFFEDLSRQKSRMLSHQDGQERWKFRNKCGEFWCCPSIKVACATAYIVAGSRTGVITRRAHSEQCPLFCESAVPAPLVRRSVEVEKIACLLGCGKIILAKHVIMHAITFQQCPNFENFYNVQDGKAKLLISRMAGEVSYDDARRIFMDSYETAGNKLLYMFVDEKGAIRYVGQTVKYRYYERMLCHTTTGCLANRFGIVIVASGLSVDCSVTLEALCHWLFLPGVLINTQRQIPQIPASICPETAFQAAAELLVVAQEQGSMLDFSVNRKCPV